MRRKFKGKAKKWWKAGSLNNVLCNYLIRMWQENDQHLIWRSVGENDDANNINRAWNSSPPCVCPKSLSGCKEFSSISHSTQYLFSWISMYCKNMWKVQFFRVRGNIWIKANNKLELKYIWLFFNYFFVSRANNILLFLRAVCSFLCFFWTKFVLQYKFDLSRPALLKTC